LWVDRVIFERGCWIKNRVVGESRAHGIQGLKRQGLWWWRRRRVRWACHILIVERHHEVVTFPFGDDRDNGVVVERHQALSLLELGRGCTPFIWPGNILSLLLDYFPIVFFLKEQLDRINKRCGLPSIFHIEPFLFLRFCPLFLPIAIFILFLLTDGDVILTGVCLASKVASSWPCVGPLLLMFLSSF